jgi:uncharacterized protein involved in exopolysaccharide biosynthesis
VCPSAGAARNEVAVKGLQAEVEARAKAKADEEARKGSPDYLQELVQRQAQAQATFKTLDAQIKQAKPVDEIGKQELDALKEQRTQTAKELAGLTRELRNAASPELILQAQIAAKTRNPEEEMLAGMQGQEGMQTTRGKWGQQEVPPEMRRTEPMSSGRICTASVW